MTCSVSILGHPMCAMSSVAHMTMRGSAVQATEKLGRASAPHRLPALPLRHYSRGGFSILVLLISGVVQDSLRLFESFSVAWQLNHEGFPSPRKHLPLLMMDPCGCWNTVCSTSRFFSGPRTRPGRAERPAYCVPWISSMESPALGFKLPQCFRRLHGNERPPCCC